MNIESVHAYTAGIVDGEGCIGLRKGYGREVCTPWVEIVNTKQELAQFMEEHYRGWTYVHTPRPRQPNSNISYRWRIVGCAQVVPFLQILLPYLMLKKSQALLVIEFAVGKELKVLRDDGHYTLSEGEITRRRNLSSQVALLNRRGL